MEFCLDLDSGSWDVGDKCRPGVAVQTFPPTRGVSMVTNRSTPQRSNPEVSLVIIVASVQRDLYTYKQQPLPPPFLELYHPDFPLCSGVNPAQSTLSGDPMCEFRENCIISSEFDFHKLHICE